MQITAVTPDTPLAPPAPPRALASLRWLNRRALLKAVAAGAGAGLLLFVVGETLNIVVGTNYHQATPDIYRCAQLSGPQLAYHLKHDHIRTVINLRGCCEPSPWYLDEARVASDLGVSLEDLSFSAGRLPSVDTIRELVAVLERSDYPILVHCHRGIDRTGMAVVMAYLLRTDCSLDDALYQLGPRYGHLPLGRTGEIDRFFELYQEWLAQKCIPHTRPTFRHWVLNEYCPGEGHCNLEVLEPKGLSPRVPVGRPFTVRVRCHNVSVKPWRFRPGTDAGIHAVFQLFNDQGAEAGFGRAGLFHAIVPPGESIDLTLALPPLPRPGHYQMRLDMKDEQHGFFFQLGYDPYFWDMTAE